MRERERERERETERDRDRERQRERRKAMNAPRGENAVYQCTEECTQVT
jgi:hypothetical protein